MQGWPPGVTSEDARWLEAVYRGAPISSSAIARRAGLGVSAARKALTGLLASGVVLVVGREWRDRLYDLSPVVRRARDRAVEWALRGREGIA